MPSNRSPAPKPDEVNARWLERLKNASPRPATAAPGAAPSAAAAQPAAKAKRAWQMTYDEVKVILATSSDPAARKTIFEDLFPDVVRSKEPPMDGNTRHALIWNEYHRGDVQADFLFPVMGERYQNCVLSAVASAWNVPDAVIHSVQDLPRYEEARRLALAAHRKRLAGALGDPAMDPSKLRQELPRVVHFLKLAAQGDADDRLTIEALGLLTAIGAKLPEYRMAAGNAEAPKPR